MFCPVCNHKSTRVVDSRLSTDSMSVRRRRECERQKCAFRFSTVEEMELLDITVVKRNGRRESYSREKIESGFKKSLEKRPYTEVQLRTMVHDVEREIQKRKGTEITSKDVGDIVMDALRQFDKVAYIRFASVYYSFEGIDKFEEELRKLSVHGKTAGKKKK
ncbi:MAG: transcriptional regulator NrdR [Patescibacteria group bacterium]